MQSYDIYIMASLLVTFFLLGINVLLAFKKKRNCIQKILIQKDVR